MGGFCTACGEGPFAGERFCTRCGAALWQQTPSAAAEAVSAVFPPVTGTSAGSAARLIVGAQLPDPRTLLSHDAFASVAPQAVTRRLGGSGIAVSLASDLLVTAIAGGSWVAFVPRMLSGATASLSGALGGSDVWRRVAGTAGAIFALAHAITAVAALVSRIVEMSGGGGDALGLVLALGARLITSGGGIYTGARVALRAWSR